MDLTGRVLDGWLRVLEEAGSGSSGTVYRARDLRRDRPIALKVVALNTERGALRFEREVAILADVHHPGIVEYVGHGRLSPSQAYLVMEWVDGHTLAEQIARVGLTVDETVALGTRLAHALGELHDRGAIHRDVKPANVILPSGDPAHGKLVDLGIVRQVDSLRLTPTNVIVGTPPYMSPEQARGSLEIDGRSDVFSLGCVLYECLTGRRPFPGDNITVIRAKVLFVDPVPLAEACPECPPALADLVARMMAKEASERLGDARAVARALDAVGTTSTTRRRRAERISTPTRLLHVGPDAYTIAAAAAADDAPEPRSVEEVAACRRAVEAIVDKDLVRVEALADRTIVVTLRGQRTIAARQVAGCALAIRQLLPEAPVVVASGPAASEIELMALIDRSLELLAGEMMQAWADPSATSRGILLDERAATLLAREYLVTGERRLTGARHAL